jgi:hypothetical protein
VSPRYRWVKLYTVAYIIAASVSATILIVMNYETPAKDRPHLGILNYLGLFLFYLLAYVAFFFVVGVGFATRQYAVQSELEQNQEDQTVADAIKHVELIPDYSPPTDGPGRYRVQGVDRNSEHDKTLDIEADSAANARIKAELQGVIVSSVTKGT